MEKNRTNRVLNNALINKKKIKKNNNYIHGYKNVKISTLIIYLFGSATETLRYYYIPP